MEVEPSVSVLASTSNDTKTAEANIRPNQRNMGRRSASSTSTASSGKSRRSRPKSESHEEPVKFEIGSVSSESLASSATDADVEDPNEEPENLKTSKTKTSRTPRSSRKSLQILNNKASNHTCTVKSKLSQIDEDPIGESKKSIKKTRVNNLDENTLDGFSSLGDKVNPDENSQDTEATSSILSSLIDNSKPESQPKIDQLDETTGDCDVILKNDLDEDSKPAADTNDEHGPKKKRKKRSTLMLHHNLNLEFSKDGLSLTGKVFSTLESAIFLDFGGLPLFLGFSFSNTIFDKFYLPFAHQKSVTKFKLQRVKMRFLINLYDMNLKNQRIDNFHKMSPMNRFACIFFYPFFFNKK
ncbi:hypothetical protein BpHYR1_030312 [Brachionus plicatilis]|uniref:Uncharacterized protein n=1 Tax=Brachionus plicatilis TaxID=10195 RepID=A0A3M7RRF4_BRAPC|nr:hypothetical protein BpHYR1_030312 [Brachionus plicatilis]